jgi:hypothetical protein
MALDNHYRIETLDGLHLGEHASQKVKVNALRDLQSVSG